MAYETPEAIDIPKLNPLLRNIVQPPVNLLAPDNASYTAYDEDLEARCEVIQIQNRSDAVLYVSFNTDCSPVLNHEILSAGSAENDGLGGVGFYDVKKRGIRKIAIYSTNMNASIEKFQYNQMAALI